MLVGFSLSAVGAPGIPYRVLAAGGLVAAAFQLVHTADDFLTYGQTGFLQRLAAEAALAWILAASGVLLVRGPHHRAAGRRFRAWFTPPLEA
jgi:hypothetical protein